MSAIIVVDDLLSKLHFSIVGRQELSQDLREFFNAVCGSTFVKRNRNITLVSYSFASLKNPIAWETADFSHDLFFYSADDRFSLAFLNAYYGFRSRLSGGHESNNVARLLSDLFIHDLGFRIRYVDNDENWQFGFVWASNTFSIKIPLSRLIDAADPKQRFEEEFGNFIKPVSDVISNNENICKLRIKTGDQRSIFKKSKEADGYCEKNDPIFDPYIERLLNVFNVDKVNDLRKEMISGVLTWHACNPGYLQPEKTEELVGQWIDLLFQILFVSLVYESWVEYFPATCGIEEIETKDGNDGTKRERRYRNLGAVIVGYRFEDDLSDDERSAFKLVSSRANGAIAGDFLFQGVKQLKVKHYRRHFVEVANCLTELSQEVTNVDADHGPYLHGNALNDKLQEFVIVYVSQHQEILGRPFVNWVTQQPQSRFSKYLTLLFCPKHNKSNSSQWNSSQSHFFHYESESEMCCPSSVGVSDRSESDQDDRHKSEECDVLRTQCVYCSLAATGCYDYADYYVNLPLINALIEILESPSESKRDAANYLEISEDQSARILTFTFNYVNKFISANFNEHFLEDGHDFTGFLKINVIALLAIGNVQILNKEGLVKFDLYNWYCRNTVMLADEDLEGFTLRIEIRVGANE